METVLTFAGALLMGAAVGILLLLGLVVCLAVMRGLND